jgi:uncharacterized delta-60 repeat protein
MLSTRRLKAAIGVFACVVLMGSAASALPGDVDNGFGTNGRVVTDIGRGLFFEDHVLQPDGKIVALGRNWDRLGGAFMIARYMPNGTLDPSFTGGGYGIIEGPNSSVPVAIAMQGSKIVILGDGSDSTTTMPVLLRLTTSGGLDPSFGGGDGVVTRSLPDGFIPRDLAVQPDGKIVTVGVFDFGADKDMVALRFQPNGGIDAGFGTAGVASVGFPAQTDNATSVALQPDGKIVIGGRTMSTSLDFMVSRLLANGDPDGSFGSSGAALASFATDKEDGANAVAVMPNGKIVAAGYYVGSTDEEIAVARFTSTGIVDSSFAGSGRFSVDMVEAKNDEALDVLSHTGGSILVAGYSVPATGRTNGVLLRLTPGGVLDNNFSSDGRIVEGWDPLDASYESLAIRPDGSIVAGVRLMNGGEPKHFGLARYRDRAKSAVTLDIAKRGTKVKASGEVLPDEKPGQKVTVTLFKKRAGRFRRVAGKSLTLNPQGAYSTRFGRPAAKTCRIDVAYGGDAFHLPSKRSKTFAC